MKFNLKKEPSDDVRRSRLGVLNAMVAKYSPSIVALQEAPSVPCLESVLGPGYHVIEGPRGIMTALLEERWPVHEAMEAARGRALVVKVESVSPRARLRVWNVHAPVLWTTLARRQRFVRGPLQQDLNSHMTDDRDRLDLIVGDFNLPPYDQAMVDDTGLNANRSYTWASSKKRASRESIPSRLFNATWVLLGLVKPPYGSYYRSGDDDGPWLVPDQALMSAELALPGTRQVSLVDRVWIDAAREVDLRASSRARAPKKDVGSDHFPLYIRFRAA